MTTSQFARYLGMSNAVAWRRLRRLRDLELVRVHVERMEDENTYTLASAGAAELARITGRTPEDFRVPKGVVVASAHHRALVDFLVTLSVAISRTEGHVRLSRIAWEHELRARVGHHTRDALIPDAVVVLEGSEGRTTAFAVEVDLCSERASLVCTEKFAPYAALREAGHPLLGNASWSVLVLAPSLHRVHTLARSAWEEGEVPEGLLWCAVAGALSDRSVLTDGWVTPRLSGEHAVLATESPFAGVRTKCSDGTNSSGSKNQPAQRVSCDGPAGPIAGGGRR